MKIKFIHEYVDDEGVSIVQQETTFENVVHLFTDNQQDINNGYWIHIRYYNKDSGKIESISYEFDQNYDDIEII